MVKKVVKRFRSREKGMCWCCNNVGEVPLYPVGTVVGMKLCCAGCCRDTFGCRPGFTLDGVRLSERFATRGGIADVERERELDLERRRAAAKSAVAGTR